MQNKKAFNFKAACVVYSWGCFMKMSLLLIPEMGFHPTDTANSIAGRCTKAPKQMGECHYLISQWVIHGFSHFLPLHLSYFSRLHHRRRAYLSCAVSQGVWWSVRIADGERESCLNVAWCSPKLWALMPSRHESSPVTAWCLPLQLTLSLGRKTLALIRPWSKESN